MGKIKKVYDNIEVKNHFKSHAWITVSQSFDLKELLKDLIQQLFNEVKKLAPQILESMDNNNLKAQLKDFLQPRRKPDPQRLEAIDNNNLKAQLKDFLQQRRYVIVLDDVWSINAWDALKYALPDNNCGSRILLITRIGSVASTSSIESHGNIYAMKALSPKESWILFCWKTFQEKYCPPHLEELSQSILEKCVGLPLAIVAIGGVLATKDKNRMDEWEMVMRSLGAELEGRDKLEKDYHIKIMKLIRLWTAEGFVEAKEGMTSEEVAEGYLNELVNRSLVQVAMICYDGRLRRSRIHDLFREIIISKSIEQSIVAIVSEENTRWPEKVLDLRGASLETVPNEVAKLFHLRYLSLKRIDMIGDMAQLLAPLQNMSDVAPMLTCQIHHVKGICERMMTTDGA
ncbi:disease resistance protein RPM1-like [Cornus florida]|uniref:disease resistance protein RPM1-like n=1 Tax=Cornus florida TaxID=4283 RepID=UPI00289ED8E8|nr:disease resistance protein RPM1-like [Cornus florida]